VPPPAVAQGVLPPAVGLVDCVSLDDILVVVEPKAYVPNYQNTILEVDINGIANVVLEFESFAVEPVMEDYRRQCAETHQGSGGRYLVWGPLFLLPDADKAEEKESAEKKDADKPEE
ncbi:hypothetical protein A2U01_0003741, partial [Trifolium medium]|nr:hypothetical protein [Trifolium medium]